MVAVEIIYSLLLPVKERETIVDPSFWGLIKFNCKMVSG